MQKEPIAFIINPKSGRRKRLYLIDRIRLYLDLKRYQPSFHFTEYAGHGREIVQRLLAEGVNYFVAVGGDGTVNEVGSALVHTHATMGILPTGSGNGLARHLGIPVALSLAVAIINRRRTVAIDAGTLQSKWFFCTTGIGFDAQIGHKFSQKKKRGFLSYLNTVVYEYQTYRSRKYTFQIDGKEYTRRAFLITIANAGQYGNNAFIAPRASITDGLFDVCILKPFPIFKSLIISLSLFSKSIERTNYLEVIRGRSVTFNEPRKKYIFHFDGEPMKFKTHIQIDLHHKALNVMIGRKKNF